MFCSKTHCNATSNAGTRERDREGGGGQIDLNP